MREFAESLIEEAKDELKDYIDPLIATAKTEIYDFVGNPNYDICDSRNAGTILGSLCGMKSEIELIKSEAETYITNAITTAKTELKDYINPLIETTKDELKAYIDPLIIATKNEIYGFVGNPKLDICDPINNGTIMGSLCNMKSDVETYITNAITTAKTELKDYVDPLIATAKTEIYDFVGNPNYDICDSRNAGTILGSLCGMKSEIEAYVNTATVKIYSIIGNPKLDICDPINNGTIMGYLCEAKAAADIAIAKATIIVNKIKAAGGQLKIDAGHIQDASIIMIDTIGTEIGKIKTQFISFGDKIKLASQGIIDKMVLIRDEFEEAIEQVNEPMLLVKEFGRRIQDDAFIFIPINIYGMIYWGFLRGVVS